MVFRVFLVVFEGCLEVFRGCFSGNVLLSPSVSLNQEKAFT